MFDGARNYMLFSEYSPFLGRKLDQTWFGMAVKINFQVA